MAELSVEESQRLARLFLTGLASEADVQRLQASLPEDQTLALELLAQVQTALDDVAPEGLDKEQSQSVTARVAALVQPRVKRRGLFSLFKRLFRRRPASAPAPPSAGSGQAPAEAPSRGTLGAEPEAPAALGGDMDEGAGLEEMAPIAPAGEAAPAPAPAAEAAPAPPAKAKAKAAPPRGARTLSLALAAAAALALVLGAYLLRHRHPAPAATALAPISTAPVAPAKPLAAAAPTPKPLALPRRERAIAVSGEAASEPLPAALPPTTPQPAGQLP